MGIENNGITDWKRFFNVALIQGTTRSQGGGGARTNFRPPPHCKKNVSQILLTVLLRINSNFNLPRISLKYLVQWKDLWYCMYLNECSLWIFWKFFPEFQFHWLLIFSVQYSRMDCFEYCFVGKIHFKEFYEESQFFNLNHHGPNFSTLITMDPIFQP